MVIRFGASTGPTSLTGNQTVAYCGIMPDGERSGPPREASRAGLFADAVFRALADASRRQLLDSLHVHNGQTLRELCGHLDMTRQAVSKHLAVLSDARLVVVLRRGREKRHYLNPAPILDLAGRWIGKYELRRAAALADLKRELEEENSE